MVKKMTGIPGLNQAINANRIGMGLSSNPSLPAGLGGSIPRANLNGSPESTGTPNMSALAAIIKAAGSSGGSRTRGPRGPEKPSLARSNAISRRLNGNPSRGTELKGL